MSCCARCVEGITIGKDVLVYFKLAVEVSEEQRRSQNSRSSRHYYRNVYSKVESPCPVRHFITRDHHAAEGSGADAAANGLWDDAIVGRCSKEFLLTAGSSSSTSKRIILVNTESRKPNSFSLTKSCTDHETAATVPDVVLVDSDVNKNPRGTPKNTLVHDVTDAVVSHPVPSHFPLDTAPAQEGGASTGTRPRVVLQRLDVDAPGYQYVAEVYLRHRRLHVRTAQDWRRIKLLALEEVVRVLYPTLRDLFYSDSSKPGVSGCLSSTSRKGGVPATQTTERLDTTPCVSNDAKMASQGTSSTPCLPGVLDAAPVRPGVLDAAPVRPGVLDAAPVRPGVLDAAPVRNDIEEAPHSHFSVLSQIFHVKEEDIRKIYYIERERQKYRHHLHVTLREARELSLPRIAGRNAALQSHCSISYVNLPKGWKALSAQATATASFNYHKTHHHSTSANTSLQHHQRNPKRRLRFSKGFRHGLIAISGLVKPRPLAGDTEGAGGGVAPGVVCCSAATDVASCHGEGCGAGGTAAWQQQFLCLTDDLSSGMLRMEVRGRCAAPSSANQLEDAVVGVANLPLKDVTVGSHAFVLPLERPVTSSSNTDSVTPEHIAPVDKPPPNHSPKHHKTVCASKVKRYAFRMKLFDSKTKNKLSYATSSNTKTSGNKYVRNIVEHGINSQVDEFAKDNEKKQFRSGCNSDVKDGRSCARKVSFYEESIQPLNLFLRTSESSAKQTASCDALGSSGTAPQDALVWGHDEDHATSTASSRSACLHVAVRRSNHRDRRFRHSFSASIVVCLIFQYELKVRRQSELSAPFRGSVAAPLQPFLQAARDASDLSKQQWAMLLLQELLRALQTQNTHSKCRCTNYKRLNVDREENKVYQEQNVATSEDTASPEQALLSLILKIPQVKMSCSSEFELMPEVQSTREFSGADASQDSQHDRLTSMGCCQESLGRVLDFSYVLGLFCEVEEKNKKMDSDDCRQLSSLQLQWSLLCSNVLRRLAMILPAPHSVVAEVQLRGMASLMHHLCCSMSGVREDLRHNDIAWWDETVLNAEKSVNSSCDPPLQDDAVSPSDPGQSDIPPAADSIRPSATGTQGLYNSFISKLKREKAATQTTNALHRNKRTGRPEERSSGSPAAEAEKTLHRRLKGMVRVSVSVFRFLRDVSETYSPVFERYLGICYFEDSERLIVDKFTKWIKTELLEVYRLAEIPYDGLFSIEPTSTIDEPDRHLLREPTPFQKSSSTGNNSRSAPCLSNLKEATHDGKHTAAKQVHERTSPLNRNPALLLGTNTPLGLVYAATLKVYRLSMQHCKHHIKGSPSKFACTETAFLPDPHSTFSSSISEASSSCTALPAALTTQATNYNAANSSLPTPENCNPLIASGRRNALNTRALPITVTGDQADVVICNDKRILSPVTFMNILRKPLPLKHYFKKSVKAIEHKPCHKTPVPVKSEVTADGKSDRDASLSSSSVRIINAGSKTSELILFRHWLLPILFNTVTVYLNRAEELLITDQKCDHLDKFCQLQPALPLNSGNYGKQHHTQKQKSLVDFKAPSRSNEVTPGMNTVTEDADCKDVYISSSASSLCDTVNILVSYWQQLDWAGVRAAAADDLTEDEEEPYLDCEEGLEPSAGSCNSRQKIEANVHRLKEKSQLLLKNYNSAFKKKCFSKTQLKLKKMLVSVYKDGKEISNLGSVDEFLEYFTAVMVAPSKKDQSNFSKSSTNEGARNPNVTSMSQQHASLYETALSGISTTALPEIEQEGCESTEDCATPPAPSTSDALGSVLSHTNQYPGSVLLIGLCRLCWHYCKREHSSLLAQLHKNNWNDLEASGKVCVGLNNMFYAVLVLQSVPSLLDVPSTPDVLHTLRCMQQTTCSVLRHLVNARCPSLEPLVKQCHQQHSAAPLLANFAGDISALQPMLAVPLRRYYRGKACAALCEMLLRRAPSRRTARFTQHESTQALLEEVRAFFAVDDPAGISST